MNEQLSQNAITEFIVAEYSSLRNEIINRTGTKQNILSLTLVFAAGILGAGLQKGINSSVLLVYPILAFFLATAWVHSDIRIGQLADYLRSLEEKYPGLGWGRHIKKLLETSGYSRYFGLVSASGLFLTTEVLIVVIGTIEVSLSPAVTILLCADALSLLGTIMILTYSKQFRKKRLTKQ